MNFKTLPLLLLINIISNHICDAQSELDNHKKYWFYKSRFNNDFIKIGHTPTGASLVPNDGHGESIPFNTRHSVQGTTNLAHDVKKQVDMGSGDAPTQLGVYLSVLATEYKLLKGNQQDLSRIKHEIFCALNAINRMDYYAEPALDNSKSPDLNGFFIRDDLPRRFVIENYEHFNYFHDRIFFNPNIGDNDSSLVSGFSEFFNTHVIRGGGTYPDVNLESSQDHYYYLLMGLTLTSKLVDPSETDGSNTFGYGSGEDKLVQEAKNIADRLIRHLKKNPLWIIQNPNTNNTISGQGAVATPYAYTLDNLGCFIKHNQSLPFIHIPIAGMTHPHAPSFDYRNVYSASPQASGAWHLLATGGGGGLTVDQVGFYQILAGAGSNIYESQMFLNIVVQGAITAVQALINNIYSTLNQNIQQMLNNLPNGTPSWLQNGIQSAITILQQATQTAVNIFNSAIQMMMQNLFAFPLQNTTDARLFMNSTLSQIVYFDECTYGPNTPINHSGSDLYFGTYLRDILHGYNQSLPAHLAFISSQPSFSHNLIKNDVQQILNEAPCEGNYHYGTGPNGGIPLGAQWGAPNFIDRVDRVWNKSTCPAFRGGYAGLDYLLMHNLYYLVEGTNDFEDYIDRTETTTYPNGSSFVSSNTTTEVKGAFEYLRPANTISPNGKVLFRAGKEIIPVPGSFSVEQGAEVGFETERFYCSGVNVDMNKSSEGSSKDPFSNTPKKNVTYIEPPVKQQTIHDNPIINQFQTLLDEQKNKFDQEVNKVSEIFKDYNKISVYPNPNSGSFVLDFKLDNSDNVNVEVVDMLGRIVYSEKYITGQLILPVDLKDANKGVYIAKIKFSTGKEEIRKISIQ